MDENLEQLLSAFNANRIERVITGSYELFLHAQPDASAGTKPPISRFPSLPCMAHSLGPIASGAFLFLKAGTALVPFVPPCWDEYACYRMARCKVELTTGPCPFDTPHKTQSIATHCPARKLLDSYFRPVN
jgi:hypothetical protein